MENEEIKKIVRNEYAEVARQESSCGCGCGSASDVSKGIGYSDEELENLPQGANLGLGCGNPTALASLKEGETFLDLGSGAGIDCFLAMDKVGKRGKVIGVDMTSAMIDKARENAKKIDAKNVEFRLGEIEHLPVADNTIDVITSNCVINLSPDKKAVFKEAYRVLKPGGRLMISDIVLLKKLPKSIEDSMDAYVGCVSGAVLKDDYLQIVRDAGFEDVKIVGETAMSLGSYTGDEQQGSEYQKTTNGPQIVSVQFYARKPQRESDGGR